MSSIHDSGPDYDALAIGQDAGEEADFYASCVPPGGVALELACGTGRLTVPLAGRGLNITGFDSSDAMLEAAKAKADAQKAKADAQGVSPAFVFGDMREFAWDAPFDLIFLPNNSLGHLHTLSDICACFASVLRHLSPQGRFVVDMFSPSLPLLLREPNTHCPMTECTRSDGKTVAVSETVSYDGTAQVLHALWHYRAEGEPADVRPLDLRIFFPQELDALLTLSGFVIEAKYGGFDKAPFTGASRQQVIVCRAA